VSKAPFLFQAAIVRAEIGIGLALVGGLFTFVAAVVSIGLSLMFIIGAMAGREVLWYIAASIVMLGGAGRAFGLDHWVMPWLQRQWNRTRFARRTYLYVDEPIDRK
jgi:NADH dehydrogenase